MAEYAKYIQSHRDFIPSVRYLLPAQPPLTDTFRYGQQLMCYAVRCRSVWPLGRQFHSDGSWEGAGIFSLLSSSCSNMSFSPHGLAEFSTSLFPCKGRATRCNTKNRAYFAQNCYSSLPRFVPNRVFRKILGQISWLMPLSGRSWIPARKRTQNSTKSMTTENEGTPADLIRKDFKKKGS